MRHLVHGLLVASFATLVACGGDDKPAQDPSAMNTPPPPAPMPESKPATTDSKPVDSAMGGGTNAGSDTTTSAKPAEKPMTDAEIVAVTSTANNGEIDMANLATKTATNADVKNFAAMMITQHRDMETKGKALAAKAKITPADNDASTALKSDVQSTITSLKTQKGKDFDKAYMESQVKAHRDVLNLFDNKLLPNAQNGDLKTLLADGRSHVAAHLAKAEEIQKKLDAAPATKPATTPAKK
jgi:putative membrane protein